MADDLDDIGEIAVKRGLKRVEKILEGGWKNGR
jgi:hypothetical protein